MSSVSGDSVRAQDASGYQGTADSFFRPQDENEVVALVGRASQEHIPLTLCGARSGLTGGCVPHGGGLVSLDCFRKLEVSSDTARVGAGVLLVDLHAAAA